MTIENVNTTHTHQDLGVLIRSRQDCMPVLAETGDKISSSGGPSRTDSPVIIPDVYLGDGCCKEWINHFESSTLVNGWHNPSKLLW